MTADTSTTIEAPALDGRDPLGFLAAVGLLRLLSPIGPAKLSWDVGSGCALLETEAVTLDDLVATAVDLITQIGPDNLAPGLTSSLLPNRTSPTGPDPARLSIDHFADIVAATTDASSLSWVRAIWTDLADDTEGRCARTPFNAPAGKQTLRSMFEKPLELVRQDPERWISEALTRWTRKEGYTGEGLESRAMRDAAEVNDGASTSYGVPGATYLALLALPSFPVRGAGVLAGGDKKARRRVRRLTPGWQTAPGRRGLVFGWPLWSRPLDLASVDVLLDHPEVASAVRSAMRVDDHAKSRGDTGVRRDDRPGPGRPERPAAGARSDPPAAVHAALGALSVWAVVAAARRSRAGGKSEGFLTTERVIRVEPDRRAFAVNEATWTELQRLLDQPPADKPTLAALLDQPSVLEQDR